MKHLEPMPDLFPADSMPFNLVGETMPQEPEATTQPTTTEETATLF